MWEVISDGVAREQFARGTLGRDLPTLSNSEHTHVPAEEWDKNWNSRGLRRWRVEVLHCTNDLCAIQFYTLHTSEALEIQIQNGEVPV